MKCAMAGGCLCRCRDKKTQRGCASGHHCGSHGRNCHVSCTPKHPGQPPRRKR